ncbi:MAG: hypothetical protein V4584_14155 [Verrucomicrobiota bacterium]
MIGQLKAVFSLRFETLAASADDDFDDDGLANGEEASRGTDPYQSDTDGDGMPDGWEVTWGSDPLALADADLDTDGDHVTNLREFQLGTIPTGIYQIEVLPPAANKYFHAAADNGSVVVRSTPVWNPNTALELISAPDAGGNRTILPAPASGWNPLPAILADLVEDGTLDTGDPLNPSGPDSSDEGYRVFESNGISLILETPGGFVRTLPPATSWDAINRWGDAIATEQRSIPAANGVPAHQVADLLISYTYDDGFGETIPLPQEWFPASQMPSIQAFSDDGRVLIRRQLSNPDGSNGIATYLLDVSSGVFKLIAPATASGDAIVSLSNENGRMLGHGAQPFVITPDGTTNRLDSLRVKTGTGTVVPFGSLYPQPITPNHIASDGRITLTAILADQPVLLQLVPHNDGDHDGMADDWEKDYAAQLIAFNHPAIQDPNVFAELLSGNLNPNADYAGNGANVGTMAGYSSNRGPSDLAPNPTGLRVEMQSKGLHGKVHVTTDSNGTGYDGVYALDGLTWPSHEPHAFDAVPTVQWSKTKAEQREWFSSSDVLTDYYHFGSSSFVENWYCKKTSSIGNPPTTQDTYFVKHRKQRIRIWGRDLVAKNDIDLQYLKVTEYQNDPLPQYDGLAFEPWTTPRPSGSVISSTETVKITIPAGKTCSEWYEIEPPLVDGRAYHVSLLPVELIAHKRGTIDAPGSAIARPGGGGIYEVVTLENADYDETDWQPTSMIDGSLENRQDGKTDIVSKNKDDDFVKLRFSCPLTNVSGSSEIVFDQAGQGERMQGVDIRFHNGNGERIQLSALKIGDLKNPSGPLAQAFTSGLDLFVEIGDLGEITGQSTQADDITRKYADLIWKITTGGLTIEQNLRIYRGGFWRNDRTNNSGTIALYDGKGRKPDGTIDYGRIVKGPYQIKTGQKGQPDETVTDEGPTPMGWYGLRARNRGNNNNDMRTTWTSDGSRPQTNHHHNASGNFLGYVQQGSYCQWEQAGNHNIKGKGAYGHDNGNDADPYQGMPASIHFKFELSPIGNFTTRDSLQIHPDGFRDGTAGCIGIQAYDDCCKVLFLVRHYFQSRILVD